MTAPYQSKLIPFEDFVRQCRAKRLSYPRIAEALLKEHGLKVGGTTIFDFVKARARKRRAFELPPREEPISKPAGGFFESPAQPTKPNEAKRPKWNIDFD